ncbi:uncharacterized protein LOC142352570 isoform X1 [Convolutriloba macropyga]|uniref:uncharacterized protein LOC142352570 isoform X1 n=1 Tax=Convolutriloba macropyga TaxID=536237 RepID=UPI003F51B148
MSSKLLSLQLFSAFNYFIIVYCSFQDTILAAHNIHRVNAALMELEWNTGMAREAGNEAGKLQAETMCEQIEEKHKQPGTYLTDLLVKRLLSTHYFSSKFQVTIDLYLFRPTLFRPNISSIGFLFGRFLATDIFIVQSFECQLKDYSFPGEDKDYKNCTSPNSTSKIDSVVQILWAKTTKVGCGMSKCRNNGKTWVTCHYHPPGLQENEAMFLNENYRRVCGAEPGNWTTCNSNLKEKGCVKPSNICLFN